MRFRLTRVAAAALAFCLSPALAAAQAWPSKPIKMVVPFAAGGGTDFIGRVVAKHLSERLGTQVFVENRGGANGSIGVQAVAAADPDGYTILATSDSTLAVNPHLYPKLPYKPLQDLIPIGTMVRFPGLLAVHPSVPAKSVAELVALAKAKPGTVSYATGGIGNFSHLAAELFAQATGVKLLHVPFRGVGPAAQAVIAGDVNIMFNNIQTTIEQVKGGQLRALAVNEPKRIPSLPDLPAVAETVPGFEMAPWVGLLVPTKTPQPIVDRLSKELQDIMKSPDVVKLLTDQYVLPFPSTPQAFADLIKADTEKWGKVIKEANIKVE
ncbi:MAG TPA: tripartite tricarboxylate transporter substrate binding protein [Xanthobacteraceae bacterium]|nr:tripartite tricarboxylate transporter substrate binding protein [Xanthobacteraceae bacterium]